MIPHLDDPVLDQDHEEFLHLALQLASAEPSGAPAALEALQRHAQAHFALEDQDLRRLGGHNATCHLDEHGAVLKSLAEVLAVFRSAPEESMVRHLAQSLADELLRWLPHHIGDMDANLAAVRGRERLGGIPIKLVPRVREPAALA